MSQHYVYTQSPSVGDVTVLLGWDRPLSGYFMVIMKPVKKVDPEGYDYIEDTYLYSNLTDRNLPGCVAPTTEYFQSILTEKNIFVPGEAFNIVANDGMHNIGNKVCVYDVVDQRLVLRQNNDTD